MLAACLSVRFFRRSKDDDCDKRIKQIQKAFREGMKVTKEDDEDRWSHLP